jgi:hypothetical protein
LQRHSFYIKKPALIAGLFYVKYYFIGKQNLSIIGEGNAQNFS